MLRTPHGLAPFVGGLLLALKSEPVSRCLDKKMVLFGFEVVDLLMIFLTLSLLNFFFGATSFKLLLVWVPSALLATVLRLSKRGKPDGYLAHWLRFQVRPGIWSAFAEATAWEPLPQRRRKDSAHG